jgi:hypothetical protein
MKFIFLNHKPRYSVYHFFQKKTIYVDPNKKKIRVYEPSKMALGSLIAIVLIGMSYAFSTKETEIEIKNK